MGIVFIVLMGLVLFLGYHLLKSKAKEIANEDPNEAKNTAFSLADEIIQQACAHQLRYIQLEYAPDGFKVYQPDGGLLCAHFNVVPFTQVLLVLKDRARMDVQDHEPQRGDFETTVAGKKVAIRADTSLNQGAETIILSFE